MSSPDQENDLTEPLNPTEENPIEEAQNANQPPADEENLESTVN
jgi:hypothetical protein